MTSLARSSEGWAAPPWGPRGPSLERSNDLIELLRQPAQAAVIDTAEVGILCQPFQSLDPPGSVAADRQLGTRPRPLDLHGLNNDLDHRLQLCKRTAVLPGAVPA